MTTTASTTTEPKVISLWDKETQAKAAKQHKYVYVSAGQKQKKYKLLSGAEKAWKATKNQPIVPYVYLSDLKIMGLQKDVQDVLKTEGLSDNEIKAHFKNAYTMENHGDDYKNELEALKAYKKSVELTNQDHIKYGLEDLEWFVEALKDVKEEPIDSQPRVNNKVLPKSKRDLFLESYQKGKDSSKIVDVSTLETSGAKLRDQATKKGNKVYNEELNLETDNIKSYKKAIEWIHGSTTDYEENIDQMKTLLADKKKGKKPEKKSVEPKPVDVKMEEKKKQIGSPRKMQQPVSKSPGAIKVIGGDNFSSIPPLKK